MKKFIFALTTAILVLLPGCGTVQDKISEKVGEKVSESVLEKTIGGNVDITQDGIKVEKDGATFQSGTDLKWPKDSMGDLPEPKAKVAAVLNAGTADGCTIVLSDMNLDSAKAYVEKLKGLGYKESMSTTDADSMSYTGINHGGASVMFLYDKAAKEGSIGYSPVKAN